MKIPYYPFQNLTSQTPRVIYEATTPITTTTVLTTTTSKPTQKFSNTFLSTIKYEIFTFPRKNNTKILWRQTLPLITTKLVKNAIITTPATILFKEITDEFKNNKDNRENFEINFFPLQYPRMNHKDKKERRKQINLNEFGNIF